MTDDEALAVLCEAADKWAEEITSYVIPDGQHDLEDVEALVKQVNGINAALLQLGGPAYARYVHRHTTSEFGY